MLKQPLGKTSSVVPPLSREESELIMNSMITTDPSPNPPPPLKEPWFIGREDQDWLAKDPFFIQTVDEVALGLAIKFSDDMDKIDLADIAQAFRSLGSYVRSVRCIHSKVFVGFTHSAMSFSTSLDDVKTLAEEKLIDLTT